MSTRYMDIIGNTQYLVGIPHNGYVYEIYLYSTSNPTNIPRIFIAIVLPSPQRYKSKRWVEYDPNTKLFIALKWDDWDDIILYLGTWKTLESLELHNLLVEAIGVALAKLVV